MSNRLKMAALAVLVMGGSTAAFAGNGVDFKTSIQILGADFCGIDVAPAGKNSWALNWTLENADDESGVLKMDDDSTSDPLSVKVSVQVGSSNSCNLGGMKFGASLPTATHVDDGSKGAFKVGTTQGGFWRYMPVVAKLAAFTDAKGAEDGTTGAVALDKIKVKDAAGTEHTQGTSALLTAASDVADVADFGKQSAMSLTDNYLNEKGVAPLSVGGGNTDLTFTAELDEGATVKSALIGVGALVAKNPEDKDGNAKTDVVADGSVVNLPFTVNVDNP